VTGVDRAPGDAEPTPDEVARLEAERARLEAEVDALRAEMAQAQAQAGAGGGARRGGRPRRAVTAVLVVVTCLVVTAAVAGVWGRRNALNTDRWVQTVGPVVEDPAVQEALARWTTTEVMSLVDAESYIESVLPDRGEALAGPITSAVEGFVRDRVDTFFASDTFERLWTEVNRRAHARVVDVLEGDMGNLSIEDGQVEINLIPVINQVLARVSEVSPEIFGRSVDIPTITVDDVPDEAIEKIEDALGRDVPDNFGQFTVFEAQRLEEAQDAVAQVQRLVVLAVLLGVLLLGLTLWVSPHRRRTLIQLMVGIALGVVLVRRAGIRLEHEVVELVKPENRDAVTVVVGAFVSSLLDATAWVLAIAALVVAVALLTGPYRWAVSLRHRVASIAGIVAGTVRAAATGTGTGADEERRVAWLTAHRDALQVGGVVAAIVLLLAFDASWLGILVLVVLVAAYELVLWRLPPEPVASP
jgi:hypothetical protein